MGDAHIQAMDARNHRLLFGRAILVGKVAGDPLLEILGLADINDFAPCIQHPVDAGALGQRLQKRRDVESGKRIGIGHEVRGRARLANGPL